MPNRLDPNPDPSEPKLYQIRIQGHLGQQWAAWFGGMTITLEDQGETLLTGPVVDQAALHGLLRKVRDLGMPLLSVNRATPPLVRAPDVQERRRAWGQEEEKDGDDEQDSLIGPNARSG